ncbi:hypothetical protein D3C76_1886080 [compost metagenome]
MLPSSGSRLISGLRFRKRSELTYWYMVSLSVPTWLNSLARNLPVLPLHSLDGYNHMVHVA